MQMRCFCFAPPHHYLLLALITLTTVASSGGTTANSVVPRARGPATATIPVKHGRTGPQGLLQTNSTPLVLWCHAVDARLLSLRDGRKEPVLQTDEIYFSHNGVNYPANLSQDNAYNGTLELREVYASHAGNWTCHIHTTEHGSVNGEITVYLRPVVISNASLRIDDISKYHFEASGVSIVRGGEARLECPVFGNPRPDILWRKGNHDVVLDERVHVESDGTLLVQNATYEDEGTYTCKASNSINRREKRLQSNVTIERKLRVKSEFAWLLPLFIIIVTVLLLFVIIVFCEIRKRRHEQKQLLGNGEED